MQGYDQAYLVGRAASAIADTGTVVLVYLLGRRLLGAWPGLLAALLMALAVHAIQLSHFFTVDTFATFFSTAALWLLVRAAQQTALAGPRLAWAGHRAGPGEQAERRATAGPGGGLVGGAGVGAAGICGRVRIRRGGLARDGASWLPSRAAIAFRSRAALRLCVRVSAGLAAGASSS